jgi:hypothetical protein
LSITLSSTAACLKAFLERQGKSQKQEGKSKKEKGKRQRSNPREHQRPLSDSGDEPKASSNL